jgi:hypothetical protein
VVGGSVQTSPGEGGGWAEQGWWWWCSQFVHSTIMAPCCAETCGSCTHPSRHKAYSHTSPARLGGVALLHGAANSRQQGCQNVHEKFSNPQVVLNHTQCSHQLCLASSCRPGSKAAAAAAAAAGTTADWVKRGPRQNPTSSLLAAALSTDGKYLVVGGGDKAVHVFDAGSGAHVAAYPGHRDQVGRARPSVC